MNELLVECYARLTNQSINELSLRHDGNTWDGLASAKEKKNDNEILFDVS